MQFLHKIFPAAHLVISVPFIACALVLIFFAVTELWRAEAVALFCYQVRKWIGSFAAAPGCRSRNAHRRGMDDRENGLPRRGSYGRTGQETRS